MRASRAPVCSAVVADGRFLADPALAVDRGVGLPVGVQGRCLAAVLMVAGRVRPPFEPGNDLAEVKSGAYSPRRIAETAERVHEEIVAVAPWLDEPHFAPSIVRYLNAAARERLLHDHIMRMTEEHGVGSVSSRTFEQATAATRLAAKLGQDLGLDPIGHARLRAVAANASISAATLADLSAEGRQVRLRAEARLVEADVVDGDSDAEDGAA